MTYARISVLFQPKLRRQGICPWLLGTHHWGLMTVSVLLLTLLLLFHSRGVFREFQPGFIGGDLIHFKRGPGCWLNEGSGM